MARFGALLHLLFLFVFVFTYQSATIHSKSHLIQELHSCHTCKVSKSLEANQHETLPLQFAENIATQRETIEKRTIAKEAFDLTQKPLQRATDFDGLTYATVIAPPLTYDATAPPYSIS